MNQLPELAARLLAGCEAGGIRIMLAESLTGGLLADAIISVPGASRVVLGSIVAYDNSVKSGVLGVPRQLLQEFGAVSSQCAEAMAAGARNLIAAEGFRVFAVSTTGVAGPDSQEGKPVGQVHLAVAGPNGVSSRAMQFYGDRTQIRQQAVASAIEVLLEEITQ